jgi:two-component system, OmpR family, alkaline phosphatase synthesis response regulator PhoP
VSDSIAPEPSRKKRVLVIEDDPSIGLGLRINLETEGYEVTLAEDGERGFELASAGNVDIVLLDLMLPKRNGFEILDGLRKRGIATPVILLSARTEDIDKVTGLELGAEDYVCKPFSLAELLARIRAALRRSGGEGPRPVLAFGDVKIDFAARSISRGGEPVEMTATEFDVRAGPRALARRNLSPRLGTEPPRHPAHHRQLPPAAPRQARGRPAKPALFQDRPRRGLPLRRVSPRVASGALHPDRTKAREMHA